MLRGFIGIGLLSALALSSGCLSSNPQGAAPAVTPQPPTRATVAGQAVPATGAQPQAGTAITFMGGVIVLNGAAPPPDSTLFLGLAKSADDRQPRTCVDAERDPVDGTGKFQAQVSCTPQPGDQLNYVLVIGSPGERDWHAGVVPLPADLTNIRLNAQ